MLYTARHQINYNAIGPTFPSQTETSGNALIKAFSMFSSLSLATEQQLNFASTIQSIELLSD